MEVSQLNVGQVIKNYKALCEVLGIEPKGGHTKISQHKEFDRFFKYHKEGNKYVIDEIYEETREKIDMRKEGKSANNNIFQGDFEILMLNILKKNGEGNKFFISKGKLYKATNLVNENYLMCRGKIPALSNVMDVKEEYIYDFYDNTSTKLRETVERGLKSMRNKALLMWSHSTAIATYETTIIYNEFGKPLTNSDGKIQYESKLVQRECTDIEKQTILRYENEVLEEMGYGTRQRVFLAKKWKKFKTEVEKRLKATTNIKYYYEVYSITYNHDHIVKALNGKDKAFEVSKDDINHNMIKSITKATINRNEKAEVDSIIFVEDNKKQIQAEEDYVYAQEQLTMTLIYDKTSSIEDKIYKVENKPKPTITISYDIDNSDIPF